MKILHILDHSLPLHSGYTFRSQNIFKAQKARGWEVIVVTSPKHEADWKGDWAPEEEIEGIRYYRSGKVEQSSLPGLTELALMRRLQARIREVAEKEKPDVIHAHSPVLNVYPALKVGRKLGIPVVYEIRAFWEDAAVDHGTCAEGSPRYRLTKALETRACQRADHVFVLCNGLKNDLISRGIPAEKLTPVFNGVNPEDFKPCPADEEYRNAWGLAEKRIVGFIGSFYRYEGLDLLIRAFAVVHKANPDTVLLLVGGGEMEAELKTLAHKLNLQDTVIMPGRIPHNRVPGVYSLIDILVYPRYSMRLTELVTPLKPLESMAMGKVLVASDVGGHKELIRDGETGVLFKAGDELALIEQLQRLLDSPDLQHGIAEQAGTWVREHHTWAKTTDVYNVYKDLL